MQSDDEESDSDSIASKDSLKRMLNIIKVISGPNLTFDVVKNQLSCDGTIQQNICSSENLSSYSQPGCSGFKRSRESSESERSDYLTPRKKRLVGHVYKRLASSDKLAHTSNGSQAYKKAMPDMPSLDMPVLSVEEIHNESLQDPQIFCEFCNKRFACKSGLRKHLKKKHELNPQAVTNMIREIKTNLPDRICYLCKTTFYSTSNMLRHLAECHMLAIEEIKRQAKLVNFDYTCEFCGLSYRTENGLKKHFVNKHIQSEGKKANQIEKKRNYTTKFLRPNPEPKPEPLPSKDLDCEICNNIIANFRSHFIEKHNLDRVGVKNFFIRAVERTSSELTCNICKIVFKNLAGLTTHMKWKHQITPVQNSTPNTVEPNEEPNKQEINNFSCDQCTRKFPKRISLIRHQSTHIRQANYVCEICNDSFWHQILFNEHKNLHQVPNEIKKPFKCEICNYRLLTETQLAYHKNSFHSTEPMEEVASKCRTCDRMILNKTYLRVHESTCGKIYACKHCDHVFSSPVALKVHKREHTG